MKIKVYKTPTCSTCTMAANRLKDAGADVELVDLSEHPDVLASLKDRLGIAQGSMIQVPKFETEDGELSDITNLSGLLSRAAEVA